MNNKKSTLLSMLLATALTACGGGSDSPANNSGMLTQNSTPDGSGATPLNGAPSPTNSAESITPTPPGSGGTVTNDTDSASPTPPANGGTVTLTSWVLTDIGTNKDTLLGTSAINENGQVAGLYTTPYTGGGPAPHNTAAFLYSAGLITELGAPVDPGTTYYSVVVDAMNDKGDFVGCVGYNPLGRFCAPIAYQNGAYSRLWQLAGFNGEITTARDINNTGQIVGTWVSGNPADGGARPQGAYILEQGKVTDLLPLGARNALAISNTGYVVGQTTATRCFLYQNGKLVELPPLNGDSYCVAYDVNDSGQVIGMTSTTPFLYADGKMTELRPPEAAVPSATRINSQGQILMSGTLTGGGTAYYLYASDNYRRLDTLDVFKSSGWTNLIFKDINDKGQITGDGVLNGKRHGFILSPR